MYTYLKVSVENITLIIDLIYYTAVVKAENI